MPRKWQLEKRKEEASAKRKKPYSTQNLFIASGLDSSFLGAGTEYMSRGLKPHFSPAPMSGLKPGPISETRAKATHANKSKGDALSI